MLGGYEDIHNNLRYWIARLVDTVDSRPIVMYDIGANDGEITLPYCRQPHRVIAFEPVAVARDRLLERAAETAELACLTVIPCALGSRAGQATIDVYSDDTFSSLFKRPAEDLARYDLKITESQDVPVYPLDSLPEELAPPPPDIVKIDVEGAERDVLLGASRTLRTYQPAIVMEFSCINTENAGYRREELLELLRGYGYERVYGLYRNTDRGLYQGPALESCRIWNVLALPPRFESALTDATVLREISPEPE